MVHRTKTSLLAVLLALSTCHGQLCPESKWTYGWEDGGTYLGGYNDGNLERAISQDQAYEGTSSLKIVEDPLSGTPQTFVAWVTGLADGDTVTGSFFVHDTIDGSHSARIWGSWSSDSDITDYTTSAGGSSDYSVGTGWNQLSWTWTSDSASKTALVIQVRMYASDNSPLYIDSLEVCTSSSSAVVVFPSPPTPLSPPAAPPSSPPREASAAKKLFKLIALAAVASKLVAAAADPPPAPPYHHPAA